MAKGIQCFYTSHWFKNPLCPEFATDIHTVAMYKVENAWYICDFVNAFCLYLASNSSMVDPQLRTNMKKIYGRMTTPQHLLAIPLDEYQKKWVYDVKKEGGVPAVVKARIDMIGWYPLKFDDYKNKTAYEAIETFEHFEEMKPDDLEKYYGVRTIEEAKRLFEGRTLEQIKDMVLNRLRSSAS